MIAARQESISNTVRVEAGFVFTPHVCREFSSSSEILFNFRALAQIIADHCIHVSQLQGRILLDDFFGSRPFGKGFNNDIQGDSGGTNANDIVGIATQRNRLRFDHHRHIFFKAYHGGFDCYLRLRDEIGQIWPKESRRSGE